MAPSVKLQVTPSSPLNVSVKKCARRRSEAMTSARSAAHCLWLWSPGLGGLTMRLIMTWPTTLGDRLMDAIL